MKNILVALKSCTKDHEKFAAQLNTWGKMTRFPMDCILAIQEFTGSMLGVPDDYDHLPFKTQAICKYAFDKGFDYAHLTDTDTYVVLERLLNSGYEEHDYTGHWHEGHKYAYGGPGYWLSRKAMQIVAGAPCTAGWEDEFVGLALNDKDIKLHHDSRYSIYEECLQGNDIISQHLSGRGAFEIPMMYEAHERFLATVSKLSP